MKDLSRNSNHVTPSQGHHYSIAQKMEELEGYRKQADEFYDKFIQAEETAEKFKLEAEQASKLAKKRKQKNQNLIQRLMDAVKSRNSMRGRLGNMTMQRNRALRQVEAITAQNREVMEQLKQTTDKLGESYQQLGSLQAEYVQDMTELAISYQEVAIETRAALPDNLRNLLDQIEQDYSEIPS